MKTMKTIKIFLLLGFFPWSLVAQPCVDPTLIDSMAICPMVYNPVCGCDGVTYDNFCIATNLGGVTSWTPGPCNPPSCVNPAQIDSSIMCPAIYEPVCGCDSVTYSNSCEAFSYVGVSSWTPGPCTQNNCINPAQIDVSVLCPGVVDPVCGCDSVTYSNDCEAFYYGGVTSWIPGPCQPLELDTCLTVPDSVNFGACAMALGIIRQNDSCFTVSGCSTIGSNGIDYSGYFYNSLYACNNLCANDTLIDLDCVDTNLIDLSVLCPDVIEPVCGCDSVTYENACVAENYFGVTNYEPGECPWAEIKWYQPGEVRLFPNPSNDKMYVFGISLFGVKSYSISSMDGRTVVESSNPSFIDISELAPGKYAVQLYLINGQTVARSIVKDK
jgi:hypothetical protein